ncbi:MAG: hypothetical protein U0174_14335 [Polyangiaceae bacterium]
MKHIVLSLGACALLLGGCEAHVRAGGRGGPGGPGPGPGPGPVNGPQAGPGPGGQVADARRDAAFDARSGWDKLGERMVDGKGDRDTIPVGRADGKFTRIQIIVEMSSLAMDDLVVTFGDGTTFSPATRLVFDQNSKSRVIDLPGGARVIRKVDFKYGNLPGGGRAQVELWGK